MVLHKEDTWHPTMQKHRLNACLKLIGKGAPSAGRLAHFKKKFQLTKNLLLCLRQDLPKMNFGVIPSPEIQLEHVVRNLHAVSIVIQFQ